jgi:hypothetical protein
LALPKIALAKASPLPKGASAYDNVRNLLQIVIRELTPKAHLARRRKDVSKPGSCNAVLPGLSAKNISKQALAIFDGGPFGHEIY